VHGWPTGLPENNFGAAVFSDLGWGLGLLRVTSLPGVNPNPLFGLILDLTG